ncbi:hypothetical protein A0H81_10841 [Grifola frondosa]|uniref:Uncharacterized protein n=1 Tax=Grifola frondosa TaxID=5627 RepID=A0A1C7LX83_GRIFR|nr:hypothetical protein A0H81_10841 [Grifola frondosa]
MLPVSNTFISGTRYYVGYLQYSCSFYTKLDRRTILRDGIPVLIIVTTRRLCLHSRTSSYPKLSHSSHLLQKHFVGMHVLSDTFVDLLHLRLLATETLLRCPNCADFDPRHNCIRRRLIISECCCALLHVQTFTLGM